MAPQPQSGSGASPRPSTPTAVSAHRKTIVSLPISEQISQLISSLTGRAESTSARQLIGIVGSPGTGKTTFADFVAAHLPPGTCVIVPMDGFHLSNEVIEGTPLQLKKGAIETFDAGGYVSLLKRIHQRTESVVYAPSYRRGLEDPIAASIAVPATARYILTEGNYLLSDQPPWNEIPKLLTETWFVQVPEHIRTERLIARHLSYGMSRDAAAEWAAGTDAANARYVETTRSRADHIVDWW